MKAVSTSHFLPGGGRGGGKMEKRRDEEGGEMPQFNENQRGRKCIFGFKVNPEVSEMLWPSVKERLGSC